jgi:hypothetical protein
MSSGPEHTNQPIAAEASREQQPAHNDTSNDVPSGYWRSFRFLGSMLAIILLANGLFIGYVMPVMNSGTISWKK